MQDSDLHKWRPTINVMDGVTAARAIHLSPLGLCISILVMAVLHLRSEHRASIQLFSSSSQTRLCLLSHPVEFAIAGTNEGDRVERFEGLTRADTKVHRHAV